MVPAAAAEEEVVDMLVAVAVVDMLLLEAVGVAAAGTLPVAAAVPVPVGMLVVAVGNHKEAA